MKSCWVLCNNMAGHRSSPSKSWTAAGNGISPDQPGFPKLSKKTDPHGTVKEKNIHRGYPT
jgi:hypothetical protein